MNAATWWDCHCRAFAHLGWVPAAIVYDRTKTIVKRRVRPGQAVPLHPDAAGFAEHYGFGPRRAGRTLRRPGPAAGPCVRPGRRCRGYQRRQDLGFVGNMWPGGEQFVNQCLVELPGDPLPVHRGGLQEEVGHRFRSICPRHHRRW